MNRQTSPSNGRSLSPLFCFLLCYLGTGIYFYLSGDNFGFYSLPPAYATLPAILVAAWLSKSNIYQFVKIFFSGMLHINLLSMCLIFLLTGAFSLVAKSTGAVEAAVNIGLQLIPDGFLLPGMFIIAALVATAMGSSVGTIATISPIIIGIFDTININPLLVAGAVVSGAMFGDNLSIISDTTIAATRTQDCRPRDKLQENLIIALPAALITTLIFYWLTPYNPLTIAPKMEVIKVLPYLLIFVLAVCGVNVFMVLTCGLVSAGTIGVITLNNYHLSMLADNIQQGVWSMKDITVLTLLIGGLGAVMESQGGVLYIRQKLNTLFTHIIKGSHPKAKRLKAELSISSLVIMSNIATANNTTAIILSGQAARGIATTNNIPAKRSASLLDIFSCVIQGTIPWGVQILLLSASLSVSPLSVSMYSFYPMILALVTLTFIFLKP